MERIEPNFPLLRILMQLPPMNSPKMEICYLYPITLPLIDNIEPIRTATRIEVELEKLKALNAE